MIIKKNKYSKSIFRKFDAEMKRLQKTLTKLECYKEIIESVPAERKYNWDGSAINRIMVNMKMIFCKWL